MTDKEREAYMKRQAWDLVANSIKKVAVRKELEKEKQDQ